METAAPLPRSLDGRALTRARLGVPLALTLLISVSTLVRALASWHKSTPSYFPDEYLYAELARSLAETGTPLVRGVDAGFPALLQPVLTAPLWLVDDVALSYHAVQLLSTLAMSLAVLPVYVLARRLELGAGVALGCAVFALAIPDFLYASRVLAEPFAFPLVLAAVAAGMVALARGGSRRQLLFLLLAALAISARVQFIVLPLAYAVAVIAFGTFERRLGRVVREQLLPLAAVGIGLVVSLAQPGVVGQYGAFLEVDFDPGVAERLATNAFGLAYACGWLLAPGAVLGLALALARPRSREERAFAALAGVLVPGLLAQAAVYGDLGRIQERYFFYALPLVVVLFALYASRGWPHRRVHLLLAGAALALVAVVPLTFATAALDKTQSPFLFAAYRLEVALGTPGDGALLLAAGVSVLLVAAAACSWRPRLGTAVVLALATSFVAASSLGAVVLDLENTSALRARYLPADRSWVDRAGLEDVALLRTSDVARDTYLQLFWNRSVTSLLLMPRVAPRDAYVFERVSIAPDGTLRGAGGPVVRPLLIDESAGPVELRGARSVAVAPTHRLWRPAGTPRVVFAAQGYFADGWLGRSGSFRVWPSEVGGAVNGRVTLRASPDAPTVLTIRHADGRQRYRLEPGAATTISVAVCVRGGWSATFAASRSDWEQGRFVSTPATRPVWTADARACRPGSR